MNLEIANQKKNLLLGRREIEFQIEGKPTPSRAQIKLELAKKLKAKEQLIVIDLVDQKTGYNIISGRAKVYDSEGVMSKVELDYRSKRGVKEKKEGAPPVRTEAVAPAEAEKPAENPAEEAPAEEALAEASAEEAPAEAPEAPKEEASSE